MQRNDGVGSKRGKKEGRVQDGRRETKVGLHNPGFSCFSLFWKISNFLLVSGKATRKQSLLECYPSSSHTFPIRQAGAIGCGDGRLQLQALLRLGRCCLRRRQYGPPQSRTLDTQSAPPSLRSHTLFHQPQHRRFDLSPAQLRSQEANMIAATSSDPPKAKKLRPTLLSKSATRDSTQSLENLSLEGENQPRSR